VRASALGRRPDRHALLDEVHDRTVRERRLLLDVAERRALGAVTTLADSTVADLGERLREGLLP
jgi:hypothetical protein